MVKWFIY